MLSDKNNFVYGDRRINYRLVRKEILGNKTQIQVTPTGLVLISSGVELSPEQLGKLLQRRARWIYDTLNTFDQQRQNALPSHYLSGETHFYLGRRYRLKIMDVDPINPDFNQNQKPLNFRDGVKLKRGQLEVLFPRPWSETIVKSSIRATYVKRQLIRWYTDRARTKFSELLSQMLPTVPWLKELPLIRLKVMKKLWGSCSPGGIITLNPMLVKAPRECIEYVLAHELCHLVERHHGPRFWHLLTTLNPTWPEHKTRLDTMAEIWLA